jgi:hypothetical protein
MLFLATYLSIPHYIKFNELTAKVPNKLFFKYIYFSFSLFIHYNTDFYIRKNNTNFQKYISDKYYFLFISYIIEFFYCFYFP